MSQIGKLWAGRIYGTNTGNIFVEFDEVESQIVGRLRFLDALYGITIYSVRGSFTDHLVLEGEWLHGGDPHNHGTLTINAELTSSGNFKGTWKSTIGTGGTFEIFPHDLAVASEHHSLVQSSPEQLYTRRVTLSAVRLYANDVSDLLQYAAEEFLSPRPVVTYRVRGNEVAKYATDFIQESSTIGDLDYFKLTIQEPDSHGINRLVTIELNAKGTNEIIVQGTRESWVVGRSEALASFFRNYEKKFVTTYNKYGLGINSIIFLLMLVIIPEIQSVIDRVVFVCSITLLLLSLHWFHARFIPNTYILLDKSSTNPFFRAWPTIFSWLSAVSASLVAALLIIAISNLL